MSIGGSFLWFVLGYVALAVGLFLGGIYCFFRRRFGWSLVMLAAGSALAYLSVMTIDEFLLLIIRGYVALIVGLLIGGVYCLYRRRFVWSLVMLTACGALAYPHVKYRLERRATVNGGGFELKHANKAGCLSTVSGRVPPAISFVGSILYGPTLPGRTAILSPCRPSRLNISEMQQGGIP